MKLETYTKKIKSIPYGNTKRLDAIVAKAMQDSSLNIQQFDEIIRFVRFRGYDVGSTMLDSNIPPDEISR